jgi:predicted dehydrogenase
MQKVPVHGHRELSRRDFLKQSATAAVATSILSTGLPHVFAAGSDEIKIGLVGCGGRGTGAATQALMATKTPVRLWAMADLFKDKLEASHKLLSNGGKGRYDRDDFNGLADQMTVPEERRFTGFDAYKKLLDSGVDMVILATPPVFRPDQFKAAVQAGKHVFMEKPVAVDPVGIRTVIEAATIAKQKKLSVVGGTQRRHQAHYLEIMKRIHDGAIGEITGGQCYWNQGGSSLTATKPDNMSDMEWQCRRWYSYAWLCGDHIVEQHVHNLDVMSWALKTHPVSIMGMGSRAVRQGGTTWDNFSLDIEYPGGIRIASMCRQIPGCADRVSERIVGSKGVAYLDGSNGRIEGSNPFKPGKSPNPYVQEHADLIASIRSGAALNEAQQIAESTMVAVMGRMSAYTGQLVTWDWAMNTSRLNLLPEKLELTDLPPYSMPVPGQTALI